MKTLNKVVLYLCTTIILLFASKANAQDTSSTQGLLQYILQNVDKTQVPTGILAEYGCPILPMQTFNGTLTDSNRIDMNLWRTLYFQLQTGYCQSGTNPFQSIVTTNAAIGQYTGTDQAVSIPLLIGNYASVRGDAFASNLLSYNSSQNQVYDVSGRWQSPYQTNSVFAACPSFNRTISGTASFVFNPSLVYNNTGKSISQLSIDFNNGQGAQTLVANTPITISYTDTGTKRWTITVTLNDNSTLQCYAEYEIMNIGNNASNYGLSQITGTGAHTNNYEPPIYNGFNVAPTANHSGGFVHIAYTKKNPTNTLRKPLIVIEGYDVSSIAPDIQTTYSYVDFIDAISKEALPYDFNHQLDDIAGYDLVFVNFNNGTDDIRRNAALVQDVITRVNNMKVANSNNNNIMEQNVVMGMSMGGLCARYALANMTKNNIATQTRLLITHDSPHHGANVPLGLQYFIQMLGHFKLFGYDVTGIYPQYGEAVGLLNATGTQQLLVYRATDANNYVTNTFLDGDYRSMITFGANDPQPSYRFIATALGNECGHPLFQPGKTFLNFGGGLGAGIKALFAIPIVTYKLAVEGEAYALPNLGSTNKIARLYTINNLKLFGFINIFKQLYNNTAYASGTQLAIDGVPGSTNPLVDVKALTSFPSFSRLQLSLQFNLGWIFSGYFNAYAYNQGVSASFTFVSAASALDVAPLNTAAYTDKYVNGTNPTYPSTSTTFIAQETNNAAGTTNNAHIRFTARNSNWMFDEMENVTNTLNCSSECSNSFYISGPSNFCTNGSYFIPGLSPGATISWAVNSSAASPNSTSLPLILLTAQGNGNVTLSATINTCSNGTVILTKTIAVGNIFSGYYNVSSNYVYSNNNILGYGGGSVFQPRNQNVLFSLQLNNTNLSSVSWSISGVYSYYYSGSNFFNLYMTTPSTAYSSNNATVTLNAVGPCGSFSKSFNFQAVANGSSGSYGIVASPNPASNDVTVTSTPSDNSEVATNDANPPGAATNNKAVTNTPNSHTGNTEDSKTQTTILPKITEAPPIQSIKLFDNLGKLRKSFQYATGTKQVHLDVHDLTPGIYYIEVFNGVSYERKKLLVQH